MLKDYVEKSFLKYINNDGVSCSDSSETKIYAINSSLLKTKQVVDILFTQIRTILLKLLYRLFNISCFINFYHLTFITFIYTMITVNVWSQEGIMKANYYYILQLVHTVD